MSKKFTEEQYQKIVEIYNKKSFIQDSVKGVIDYYVDNIGIMVNTNALMALAIANPLTREWAHEQFVEKEKKYYWKLNGLFLVKSAIDGSLCFDGLEDANSLSESEIREWGFNPEMFDKFEVD